MGNNRTEVGGMHRREEGREVVQDRNQGSAQERSWARGMVQAVKHLLSTHEGLSSGPQNPYIMQLYSERLTLGTGGSENLQTSHSSCLSEDALTMATLIKKRFYWSGSVHH